MKRLVLGRVFSWVTRLLVLPAIAIPVLANPPTANPPTPKDFAMKPTVGLVEMGPKGQSLSFLSRSYEQVCRNNKFERVSINECDEEDLRLAPTDKVIVVDVKTMKPKRAVPIPDDVTVNWTEWTSMDNLLISITMAPKRVSSRRGTGSNLKNRSFAPRASRILSVNMESGAEPIALFGTDLRLIRNNRYLGRTVDLLHDDPKHVVMAAYKNDHYHLFRVNVHDGSAERIARGEPKTISWQTDRDGRPAMRMDCQTFGCSKIEIFTPEEGSDPNNDDTKWTRVRTFERKRRGDETTLEMEWVAPADNPNEFYVEVEGDAYERRSIKIFNAKENRFVKDVFSDDDYDVSGGFIDPETGDYAGAYVWRDRIEYHPKDPNLGKHLKAINAYFDDGWNVSMIGFADQGRLALVWATAPNDPGGYYLYDFEKRHVSQILAAYSNLPPMFDSQTDVLAIPTRDGATITGYHTKPSAQSSKEVPLIVLVHGGPERRDFYDFNRDVQFLASRGYQVLQVNFRGSSGYGRAFAEAGYRQWAGTMHNDVMDATRHLISTGKADANKVCVMGHSYGGYAALYAGAVASDAFQCVISGAGVSDLLASLKEDRRTHGADSGVYEYWVKSIGDPRADADALKAASPVNLAHQFDDPVLLIHGEDDDNVVYSQSEAMYEALDKAGKTVTLLTLDEGHYHNRWAIESSESYFEELEDFLAGIFPDHSAQSVQPAAP